MRKVSTSLFVLGLLLAFSLTAAAQSGRRTNKPGSTTPLPAPVVAPVEPSPTAKPSPSPTKPLATLLVGMESASAFSGIPLGSQTGVLQNFVSRLEESRSLDVSVIGDNISRGEAVKRAKNGKDVNVVWLQVRADRYNSSQGAADLRDVTIEYVVYAPVTGKIVTQGRTYPQAQRSGGVIPTTKNGGLYGDYRYNQAAREAAERVMSALNLSTRPIIQR